METVNWLMACISFIGTIISGVAVWYVQYRSLRQDKMADKIERIEKDHANLKLELADTKLQAAQTYVDKHEITRLYDKIDDMNKNILAIYEKISNKY